MEFTTVGSEPSGSRETRVWTDRIVEDRCGSDPGDASETARAGDAATIASITSSRLLIRLLDRLIFTGSSVLAALLLIV